METEKEELRGPEKRVRVRLVRKLAQSVDGIDLSRHAVGDTLSVSRTEAHLLCAERWAVRVEPARRPVGLDCESSHDVLWWPSEAF
jgi:hypothetical protein